jgi:hypothetical protein
VADEDISKGKKRGTRMTVHHRSERIVRYVNENKPRVSSESFSDPHFAADDDDDLTPAHSEARAGNAAACADADLDKATGNPVPPPHDSRTAFDRVSPPIEAGHQSPSSGDHGAGRFADPMNVPGPKRLALGHDDMRLGTTRPAPLFSMRSNADDFPADLRGLSSGVPIALDRLDANAAAGLGGPLDPAANPVSRRMDHQSRGSATPANGPHGMQPLSRAPMSVKATPRREALDILKRHMFPGSGGSR